MAVLKQFLGDRPADGACSGDRDPHQWLPFPGAAGLANTEAIWLRSSSLAITYSTSPCCSTVFGPGTMAWPSREMKAMRALAAASSALTFSLSQSSQQLSSASTITPVRSEESAAT